MKKVISVLISAVIMTGILSSCKKNEDNNKENLVESVNGYVQTVMDFDKVPSNYKSVKLKNDRVYFTYLSEQDGTYSYEALKINGQALEETEIPEWMEHDNKKEITDWTEDGNGNVYIIYKDSPSVTKYSGSDKSYTEIISGENIIEKIFFSTDNSLVLKSGENVYVYDEKTELINTIKVWNSFYSDVFVYENSIIARADKNSGYTMYDIKDGTKKGEVTTSDFPISNSMKITSDEEGNLYIACINGIYLRKNGSKIWEQIANNKNNILADIYDKLFEFVSLGENLYISRQGKLFSFNYEDTITKKVFRISDIGGYDDRLIREAAEELQKRYPNINVKYEYSDAVEKYMEDFFAYEDTSTAISDYNDSQIVNDEIKKVGTEIIAGKGPDVFILDRVAEKTRREYAEKGVFLDLSYLADNLSRTGEYVESFLKAYEKDGKIYYMPAYVQPEFMMVKNEAIGHISDLKSLCEYSEKTDDYIFDPYYYKDVEEYIKTIYRYYTDFYYDDIIISEDDMSGYLKYSKQLYDILHKYEGDTIEYKRPNDEYREVINNGIYSQGGGSHIKYRRFLTQKPSIYDKYESMLINGNISASFINEGMLEETDGYEIIPTKKFTALQTIAVNSKSECVKEAEEFIKILISLRKLEGAGCNYLFVNKNGIREDIAYLKIREDIKKTNYKIQDAEKYILSLYEFNVPVLPSIGTDHILDTLLEFEPAYLKNEASLEETLSQIMNKIDLMQNE